MYTWKKTPRALGLLLTLAAAAYLPLAAKVDLSRTTPVPATEQIPVVDFFRGPVLKNPQLNLAGTHIAAILGTADDHTELLVYNMKTQAIERIGARGLSDIADVRWLDSKRLVYTISVKKQATTGILAAEAGALHDAYPLIQFVGSSLLTVPPNDRTHPVVRLAAHTENTGQYGEVAVLRTDISTGNILDMSSMDISPMAMADTKENNQKHIISRYPVLKTMVGGDIAYITDKEGKLTFGVEADQEGVFTLFKLVGDSWQKCPQDLEEIEIMGSGDNPGEIVVVGKRSGDKPRAIQIMDGATGNVVDNLIEDKNYDFDGWLYRDPVSNNIVGAIGNLKGPVSIWFTESYRNLQKAIDKMFPGQVVRILGTDEAGKMVLISSFSDRQPPIYSWVDLEKRTAGMFKNSTPWIDPQRMQPMNVMGFKTRDGKKLDACLTLPKGATKQNPPPLIVLPHEGPSGRDAWGYNAQVQFLVSRGYAVMQPNYRGSTGFRWMFPIEDYWEYRKMSDDITDATKALIASGHVDGKRVAIMGVGRFSGYLALCGVAFEPSLYRCAVSVSGCADWGRVIEETKYSKYSDPFFFRMSRRLGDPKKDPEKFAAMSPLKHASEVRAPVFFSTSEFDVAVDKSMASDMISTVRRNNPATENISFLNEAWGVHYLDNKVELYQKIESFLAKNL